MGKKQALAYGVLLSVALTGCGVKTTPEIIMPDKPVQTEEKKDSEKKEEAGKSEASGKSYTVYLVTMDLTDSYWKLIDDGCK